MTSSLFYWSFAQISFSYCLIICAWSSTLFLRRTRCVNSVSICLILFAILFLRFVFFQTVIRRGWIPLPPATTKRPILPSPVRARILGCQRRLESRTFRCLLCVTSFPIFSIPCAINFLTYGFDLLRNSIFHRVYIVWLRVYIVWLRVWLRCHFFIDHLLIYLSPIVWSFAQIWINIFWSFAQICIQKSRGTFSDVAKIVLHTNVGSRGVAGSGSSLVGHFLMTLVIWSRARISFSAIFDHLLKLYSLGGRQWLWLRWQCESGWGWEWR